MANPELTHPQHDESRAILADLRDQRVERLEADVQRQAQVIKALQDRATRAEALVNADVFELQVLVEHKDAHIRNQALIIASLRNQNNALKAGRNVAQEWHDEPTETEADLP